MKDNQTAGWLQTASWWQTASWLRLIPLVLIVAGLLCWLFRPAGIPSADQLGEAASATGFLLLIAVGAGIAAMATVQFWKVLFLPRAAFHADALGRFFGESTDQVLGLAAPTSNLGRVALTSSGVDSDGPRQPDSLLHLLDNPTEVVMGQLRSAADYILLRPEGFEKALRCLAGNAGKVAVETYLKQWKGEQASNTSSESAGRSSDAIVEVRFFVEQHLNLIHVNLKERWRRRVRILAAVVAGSTGILAVTLSDVGSVVKVSVVLAAVIWGGFFSWFARDLVALVERRRM